MKRNIKRIISVILALALIVTGISYTPKTVSAANLIDSNGMIYTIGTITGSGALQNNGTDGRTGFNFAWNGSVGGNSAKVTVRKGEEVLGEIGTKNNGDQIKLEELSKLELAAGEYTIVFEGTDDTKKEIGRVQLDVRAGKTSKNVIQLTAPEKPVLYDYRHAGGEYVIEFTDGDADMTVLDGDVKEFQVFVGGTPLCTVKKPGDSITAEQVDALNLNEGEAYEVSVKEILKKADSGEVLESGLSVGNYFFTYDSTPITALENDVPQIFVTTVRTASDSAVDLFQTGSDKTKINSTIVVKTKNGEKVDCSDTGTIALRGNSTAGADKKPYNIKFKNKHDVLGLDGGKGEKKWSLLANAFDKSLLRNQIAMQFHNYMEDNFQTDKFTSHCIPVDLYLDGKYLGAYLLIESVEAGENRVNLNVEDSENNEILLELDSTLRDKAKDAHLGNLATGEPVKTTRFQKAFTINEPGGPGSAPGQGQTQEEWKQEISAYAASYQEKSDRVLAFLNDFEKLLPENENSESDIEAISQYIDLDSFVNYYITAELFKIKDVDYSSVRFYIKETAGGIAGTDGKTYKMYAGPLWDVDLGCGNDDDAAGEGSAEIMKATTNPWFGALMKNADFKKRVVERYEAALPVIKSIFSDGGMIDTAAAGITKSADANYTKAYDDDNEKDKTNTDAESDPGYGSGWGYQTTDSNSGRGNLGGVHGKTAAYDSYQPYADEFSTWMQARNTYLMKQFRVSDPDEVLEEDDYVNLVKNKYYNLALNKKATPMHYHPDGDGTTPDKITDGIFEKHCAVNDAEDNWNNVVGSEAYVDIDLEKYYDVSTIEKILVSYSATGEAVTPVNKEYSILYSTDGIVYEPLITREPKAVDVDANGVRATIDDVKAAKGVVRYVRIYYPKAPGYGAQITEVAVIGHNAVEVSPKNVTVPKDFTVIPGKEEFKIQITADENQEGYTYAVFVDGEMVQDGLEAGKEYTIDGINEGEHEITVKSYCDYFYSESTEPKNVTVEKNVTVTVGEQQDTVFSDTKEGFGWNYVRYDGVSATASTVHGTDGAENAIDNDINSKWDSQWDTASEFITIDLGAVHKINEIAMIWNNWGAKSYSVQISTNDKEYDEVKKVSGVEQKNNRLDTIDFARAVEARYVRIQGLERYGYGYAMNEIAIYGPDENVGAIAKPEGFTNNSTPDLPYYFVWKAVEGATSYNFYINGEKIANVVNMEFQITGDALAKLKEGNNTVSVTAVNAEGKESVKSDLQLKVEAPTEEKPDLIVEKIEFNPVEFKVGEKIKVKITVKNIGTVDAKTKEANGPGQSIGGEAGEGMGYSFIMANLRKRAKGDSGAGDQIAYAGLPTKFDGTYYNIPAGETASVTYEYTVLEGDENRELFVKADTDSKIDESDETNNVLAVPIVSAKGVAEPVNLKAAVNEDKTVTVTWEAPDNVNTYGYNVYIDGVLVNTEGPINDLTYITTALSEANHTISVTSVLNGKESGEAVTNAVVYDATDANWITFAKATNNPGAVNIDANGNYWYVAENKLDYVDLFKDPNYLRITNNGTELIIVTKKGGTGAAMTPIQTVIIGDKTYTAGSAEDMDGVRSAGDQLFMDVSLFPIEEDKPYTVYPISVTGEMEGRVITKSYLVKVENSNYATAELKNVGDNVTLSWDADVTAVNGYEITYTTDEKSGEATTAVTKTVRVGAGTTTYSFTDNKILLNNNTKVIVKPVYEDDTVGNEIASATALADLVFEDLTMGGIVYAGVATEVIAKVKNIGTAKASADRNLNEPVLAVTMTNIQNGRFTGVAYSYVNDGLEPGKTIEVKVNGFEATEAGKDYSVTGWIDDTNRISESDETPDSQYKTITGPVVDKDAVKIENNGTGIKLTWKPDISESYFIKYNYYAKIPGGEILEKTYEAKNIGDPNVTDNADGTKSVYIPEALVNNSTVYVYNSANEIIGAALAQADLVIAQIGEPVGEVRVAYKFDIDIVIKNQGTAAVVGTTSTDMADYGYVIPAVLRWQNTDNQKGEMMLSDWRGGLKAGSSFTYTFKEVAPTLEGDISFDFKVDGITWAGGEQGEYDGFVSESNEENNTASKVITVLPRKQVTEMPWVRLTSAGFAGEPEKGEVYKFPVANGSQSAFIDYKVLSTTNDEIDYIDFLNKYEGYQGANFSIGFLPTGWVHQTTSKRNEIDPITGEEKKDESGKPIPIDCFDTKVELAQVPDWHETTINEDGSVTDTTPDPNSSELRWLTLHTQGADTFVPDGTPEGQLIKRDPASHIGYNGNGMNVYVGNYGLYKCYLYRFTTPKREENGEYIKNEVTGEYEVDQTVIAFRVTDDQEHTRAWMQALENDKISNPNALPIPYCGGDSMVDGMGKAGTLLVDKEHHIIDMPDGNFVDNTEHENTEASHNYETVGALWYDASDIMLSNISVYNGNWLSITTSQYLEFDKEDESAENDVNRTAKYRVGIARAHTIPEENNKFIEPEKDVDFEGFVVTDPNQESSHLGIQGTNTIQVGLPWLLQELPTHSELGAQKDKEYYWIRIWANYGDNGDGVLETTPEHLQNYVDIPITIYYDVPQIQPAQKPGAITSYDNDDHTIFSISWGTVPEQDAYGYKYKVFIPDINDECTELDPAGTLNDKDISLRLAELNGIETAGYIDNNFYFTSAQMLESDNELFQSLVNNKLKIVAYWCEQEIATTVDITPEHEEGWHSIDGESTLGIQAGKSNPVDMPGNISYYYNRQKNHSGAVVGYNGYWISLNGNTRYFASNSKVSVARQFDSRTSMKEVYDELYSSYEALEGASAEDNGVDPTAVSGKENELNLSFATVENKSETGYVAGQLQMEAKDLMTAGNLVTWYLVKVETPLLNAEGGDTGKVRVAYMMLESIVEVGGDVGVRGFQMNTDTTPGGVSEYSPSFRAVSRASKIIADDTNAKTHDTDVKNIDSDKILYYAGTVNSYVEAIIAQGTIYAKADAVTDEKMAVSAGFEESTGKLLISTDEENGVYQIPTTQGGVLTNWSGSVNDADKDLYTYYAVTFKPMNYSVKALLDEYLIKAYAVTEDGEVVYEATDGENSPSKKASVYKIAEQLYSKSKMNKKEDHEFLYNNVLNIANIYHNYAIIGNKMLVALGVKDKADPAYTYVNNAYKDLYYYAHLAKDYEEVSYIKRGTFISKTIVDGEYNEKKLLPLLNAATATEYVTIADWIYNQIDHTDGFYEKVEYVDPNAGGIVGIDGIL